MKRGQANIIVNISLILMILVSIILVGNIFISLTEEKSNEVEISGFKINLNVKKIEIVPNNKLIINVQRNAGKGNISKLVYSIIGESDSVSGDCVNSDNEIVVPDELESVECVVDNSEYDSLGEIKELGIVPVFKNNKLGIEVKKEYSNKSVEEIGCYANEDCDDGNECTHDVCEKYCLNNNKELGISCGSSGEICDGQGNCVLCYDGDDICPSGCNSENDYDCLLEDENLISYWKFEGNALDFKGNYNGSLNGNENWINSDRGLVVDLSSGGKITFNNLDDTISDEMSISYWMNWTDDADSNGEDMLRKYGCWGLFFKSDGKFYAYIQNAGGRMDFNVPNYGDNYGNGWNHIFFIHNKKNVSLYINNVLFDSKSNSGGDIDKCVSPFAEDLHGYLDDMMFFKKALSENERTRLYSYQNN